MNFELMKPSIFVGGFYYTFEHFVFEAGSASASFSDSLLVQCFLNRFLMFPIDKEILHMLTTQMIIKLVTGFITILIIIRLLGRRNLSQLTPGDIVYFMVFGGY